MKKYLLGLTALVLAVGFSAFTKPVEKKANPKDFRILGANRTQSYVADPVNWQEGSPSCPDLTTPEFEACRINSVDELYYHETSTGSGVFKLNDAAFIATDRTSTVDVNDLVMNIPTVDGSGPGTSIYIVSPTGGTLSSGTQDNRNEP